MNSIAPGSDSPDGPGSVCTGYSATVFVVILNWNGRDDTLACLQSVEKIAYPDYRVIVVDNGSADDSVAAIRAAFPEVDLIETTNGVNKTRARAIG